MVTFISSCLALASHCQPSPLANPQGLGVCVCQLVCGRGREGRGSLGATEWVSVKRPQVGWGGILTANGIEAVG